MGILDCAIGKQGESEAAYEGFGRLLLSVGPQCLLHPAVQKGKLAFGVEPVLAAGHDGQASMVLLGKCRYRFNGC